MKTKYLFENFFKLILCDYLYLTLLFILAIVELSINSLLSLDATQRFSLLIVLSFVCGFLSAMNFLRNDAIHNRYFKQKINSYWLYIAIQLLTLLISNIIIAVIGFIFSFMINWGIFAIINLTTTSFVGTGLAFLLKLRFDKHPLWGQLGVAIFLYLALADSSTGVLYYINWVLPPISKMIVTFQDQLSMKALLPISGRQLIYSLLLFVISGVFYQKKFEK